MENIVGTITPNKEHVIFLNNYIFLLDYCEFDKRDDPNKEEESYLNNMDHKYPSKCTEITSLLHVLQWAYWKETRRKAKCARKRAAKEMHQTESSVSSKKTKE